MARGKGNALSGVHRALHLVPGMVRGARGLSCFTDSQHLASCGTLSLGPAAKRHLQCSWSGRSCRVQSKVRTPRELPQHTQVVAQTLARPLAGGRARTRVLTVLRQSFLSLRYTSCTSSSRILRALPPRQAPLSPGGGVTEMQRPRCLRREERAGPCPPAPQLGGETPVAAAFGGLDPAPRLTPTSPLCSRLSCSEHPASHPWVLHPPWTGFSWERENFLSSDCCESNVNNAYWF